MKRYNSFAFWALFGVLMYGLLTYMTDTAHGQGRGDKRPAFQILRDSTITRVLIDPEFLAQIVFESSNGNAPIADSALALKNGVLTSGNFKSASLDSFLKLLVDSSDYARFLRDGAILSRSAFSPTAFDSLQGDANSYWVLYALNSRHADSADYSDYSFLSGTATNAQNYVGSNPVPEAIYAQTANYATTAGTAASLLSFLSAAVWDSIYDSTLIWTNSDSALFADTAGELKDNAVDRLAVFNSTIQSTYLPTANQRAALGNDFDTPLSATNPPVDSIGWEKYTVRQLNPGGIKFKIGAVGHAYTSNAMAVDTSGTGGGTINLRFQDGNGTKSVVKDSVGVAEMINTVSDADSVDYILRGTGATPDMVVIANSSPAGTNGRLWVDTSGFAVNDTGQLKLFSEGIWKIIGSGGSGGGSGTELYQHRFSASIDGDSFLVRSRRDTTFQDLHLGNDSGDTVFVKRIDADRVMPDTITASSGNLVRFGQALGTADTLIPTSTSGGYLGSSSNVNRMWNGHFATLYAGGALINGGNFIASATQGEAIRIGEDLIPDTTGAHSLGQVSSNSLVNAASLIYDRGYFVSANILDSVIVSDQSSPSSTTNRLVMSQTGGLTSYNLPVSIHNENVSISGAGGVTISGSGSFNAGTNHFSSNGLTIQSGDAVNFAGSNIVSVGALGVVEIAPTATIMIDNDSAAVFQNNEETEYYYLLTDDEKNSIRWACPDPSGTNYLITRQFLKEYFVDRYWKVSDYYLSRKDSLRYYFNQFRRPGCNDTLAFPSINMVEFTWPIVPSTPIEFPDTSQRVIMPWITPGVPVGPYWIDSTSNGVYYSDPVPGIGEGIWKVTQRANDTLAFINGRYATLKAAIDSLPNWRCDLYGDVNTDGGARELDTFRVNTFGATVGARLKTYRGDTVIDTAVAKIPEFLRQPGTFVKFEKASYANNRWLRIESWPADSCFVVRDSLLQAEGTLTGFTLTFAKMQTIEVHPAVDGSYVNIPSTITIKDCSPVKIKGYDKSTVVLTNKTNSTPSTSAMINVSAVGTDNVYLGMPIEFENISIYYEAVSGATAGGIEVSGNVTFKDVNLFVDSDGTSNPVVRHSYYDAGTITELNRPTFIVDNCVVIADSDVTIFEFTSDSVLFQSSNSAYSVSGSDGRICNFLDPWGDDPPRFKDDEFYFPLSGTFASPQGKIIETDEIPAGTSEKIPVSGCTFIGLDPSTASNVITIPSGDGQLIYSVQYNSSDTKPPAKLRDGALPVKPPYSPK